MPSGGLSRKTAGTPPTGWKQRSLPPVAGGEASADGNQAAGYNAVAGAVLDGHEISQLCDRLPCGNDPVTSGRPAARKARPERGSGKAVVDRKSTRLNSSHLVISYA